MRYEDIMKCQKLKNERMKLGLANELHYDEDIKKYFGIQFENIQHTENSYNHFDWEGNNIYIELKTRTIKKYDYETALIGYDKIKKGLKYIENGCKVFILIAYIDTGIGCWELTKEKLNYMDIDTTGCGIRLNPKENLHIPVNQLVDIIPKKPLTNDAYTKLKQQYDDKKMI